MKVHELLDAPEKWTQGNFAVREDGEPVLTSEDVPCAWCLWGAINRCYEDASPVYGRVRAHLQMSVAGWNDAPSRTFDQVRALALELDI